MFFSIEFSCNSPHKSSTISLIAVWQVNITTLFARPGCVTSSTDKANIMSPATKRPMHPSRELKFVRYKRQRISTTTLISSAASTSSVTPVWLQYCLLSTLKRVAVKGETFEELLVAALLDRVLELNEQEWSFQFLSFPSSLLSFLEAYGQSQTHALPRSIIASHKTIGTMSVQPDP